MNLFALDFGNIFHKALEKYARRVEREGLEWTEVTKEQRGTVCVGKRG